MRCEDIQTNSQCASGLTGTPVAGECGVYGDECKLKCEYNSADETCSVRDECLLLKGNNSDSSYLKEDACVNEVCLINYFISFVGNHNFSDIDL
jgi:hypothetical protein